MIKHYGIKSGVYLIVSAVLLSACGPSEQDKLNLYINEVKARPPSPIEPIPTFTPLPSFSYPENDKRRNPFKPIEVSVGDDANQSAPDQKRPKQPLEKFPLDALKFVGIIEQDGVIWALVSQPEGKINRVHTGDYMGQNFGQVIKITRTSLELQETVLVAGKWVKKTTTFNLKSDN